ncbi:MAG: DUF1559 domain-containing protein [Zavarzinella sp.]
MFRLFMCCTMCLGLQSAVDAAPPAKVKVKPEEFGIKVEPVIDLQLMNKNAIVRLKNSANLSKSANNMKMLGIAFHSYHDTMNHFPANIVDKNGKVLLSWRVLLLPYLEQEELFKQFKLNEPWDSKHNAKLIDKMPKVYQSPLVKTSQTGYTVYQRFHGKNTLLPEPNSQLSFAAITDGTSNTIMTFEGARAVVWTKPDDLTVEEGKDIPLQGGPYFNGKANVGFADGWVRPINWNKIDQKTLRILLDPQDGMPLPDFE